MDATRILVVDDDPLVLRGVERVLRRAGYEVAPATDVAEAVRYAQKLQLDAALVDYQLQRETGLQVLSRLRDLQPRCLRILMTGRTDFPMVVEAVNRGEVLRVMRKPFDPKTVLETLSDAFASAARMAQVATAQFKAVEGQERAMLDDCLNGDELRLAIQPILSSTDDTPTVAYEALLRSSHPVLNSPLAVLRVAERHKRILDVGTKVFDLARGWLERMPDNVGLFVNLHPIQLGDPKRLYSDVRQLLPFAERVTLEITERSRLTDIDEWERSIELLTDHGFSLAIDDLGAGYNSLTMLADLQPRYIKLDMSLVRNIHTEPRKRRLVELMARFADATGALTIAEGVENEDEAGELQKCGIHLLQGYFYGRPQLDVDFTPELVA